MDEHNTWQTRGETLLYSCENWSNSKIFSSGAKLAQSYDKSPKNTVNGVLAMMNHGDLQREGSKGLWKEVKTQRRKGPGNPWIIKETY